MLLHRFFNLYAGFAFSALTIILLMIFSEKIQAFYSTLEDRFIKNLNQREIELDKTNRTELAPWNAHIAPIVVPGDSDVVGKKLIDLKLRESTGVNIVMIKRGDIHIAAPDKEQMIFPHDELLVLGTDIQIQKLKVIIRPSVLEHSEEMDDVELYEYIIPSESMLVGQNIRNSGIRQQANGLVVGLERNNERLLNPESDLILLPEDRLFIVGNRKKLIRMLKSAEPIKQINA
jgi:CPA2 family monovalent cation:H+ antiporter-2